MTDRNLIGRLESGSAAVRLAQGTGLPDDLLREASRRLGVMSLVAASLWFVATVLGHLAEFSMMVPGDRRWRLIEFSDWISITNIVVSVGLFFYSRRTTKNPAAILDLGLFYLVFTCFCLAVAMHSEIPDGYTMFPMISWVGATILMFAAIIPSAPGKMALAATVAVSMNPIAMVWAKARGMNVGPLSNAIVMHYPDFLLAGVAIVISVVLTRLGQQVTQARQMGSYQLGELLGSGGMGQVYRATHRMLARPAAIKLIRPEMLGSDAESTHVAVQRFKREAEVAANLRSPHTIELYDFGVTEDETLYYVMELLEGMDLETMVRENGPLPAGRAIYILSQACESLEEAHRAGLVHRDIKPANIHVGRLGLEHDFVKVLDFGLVKSFEKKTADNASLATAVGMTPGTPAYMAPELTRGDPYDGRADIYALGCVAYYLLTGQLVFDAANQLDMIMKHYMHQPVRLSRRAGFVIPKELEDIVLSCLEKEPDNRPSSAIELARELRALEIPGWDNEQARRWWGQNGASAAPEPVNAFPV